jgi:hypothetical protein
MIHDEICTYEVAKLAKEKGFIPHKLHECPRYKEYYAPSQSLLQRWLREEKGIVVEVMCVPATRTSSKYEYKRHLFWGSDGYYLEGEYGDDIFDTYELALEDALKYALENLV